MLGYGPEDKSPVLELTYNYGITDYDKGNGYAQVYAIPFLAQAYFTFCKHCIWIFLPVLLASLYIIFEERLNAKFVQIAIGTDDVYKSAEAIRLSGGKITLEPGPLPGINTKITACLDPDGWKSV